MSVTSLSDAQACVKTTYDEQLAAEIAARRSRTAKHPDSQHAVKIPPRFGVTPQVCTATAKQTKAEQLEETTQHSQVTHNHIRGLLSGSCRKKYCIALIGNQLLQEVE